MPVIRITTGAAPRIVYLQAVPHVGESIVLDDVELEVLRVKHRACSWDQWAELEVRQVAQLRLQETAPDVNAEPTASTYSTDLDISDDVTPECPF
jgi:hypothetical protein